MNQQNDSMRLPPQNLDAERGVLGSILCMNEAIDEIGDILKADHFYCDGHQKLYAAIRGMYESGIRGIDGITLSEELTRREQFEEVGGSGYLMEVLDTVPHASHARYYANIVREKWSQRNLIYAATEILANAYDASDIGELYSRSEQKILAAAEQQFTGNKTGDFKDLVVRSLNRIDERIELAEAGKISGLTSGFRDLDGHMAGLQPTELIILAARPSMGKTAFVCNMADRTSRNGSRVLLFSLEQADIELTDRLIASAAGVNGLDLRAGKVTAEDRGKVVRAAKEIAALPIHIEAKPAITMSELASIARRRHRQQPLSVVVIDYLQLIEPDDKQVPREQQIAGISRRLKFLAKELTIPVVALAQLNRQVETRNDKRPKLADLRESGAIEQDADVVMFLHRPDAYDIDDRPGLAELVIAKHRSAPTGTINLTWRKEIMRFEDYSFAPTDEPSFTSDKT